MVGIQTKTVAIIVAHPDDETLWAGGTILSQSFMELFYSLAMQRERPRSRTPIL